MLYNIYKKYQIIIKKYIIIFSILYNYISYKKISKWERIAWNLKATRKICGRQSVVTLFWRVERLVSKASSLDQYSPCTSPRASYLKSSDRRATISKLLPMVSRVQPTTTLSRNLPRITPGASKDNRESEIGRNWHREPRPKPLCSWSA